jgi:ElaB/YqjD/DUF883 family membrane-anchored ribosome-binding protein
MDAAVNGCLGFPEAQRVLDYPAARTGAEDVQVLIAVVDRLLCRIDAAADSELAKLQAEARSALAAAKAGVVADATEMREATGELHRRAARQLQLYVRDRPLVALGLSALLGLAIGFWAARSTAREYRGGCSNRRAITPQELWQI